MENQAPSYLFRQLVVEFHKVTIQLLVFLRLDQLDHFMHYRTLQVEVLLCFQILG